MIKLVFMVMVGSLLGCHASPPQVVELKPFQVSLAGMISDAARSVIKIDILDEAGNLIGTGSGVRISTGDQAISEVVSKTNSQDLFLFATAKHITSAQGAVSFLLTDYLNHQAIGFRLFEHSSLDCALIASEHQLGSPVDLLGDEYKLEPFNEVVAIGYALGWPQPTATIGFLQPSADRLLRISAPIIYGNSGGGAFLPFRGKLVCFGLTVAGGVMRGQFITHMGLVVDIRDLWR